MKTFEEIKNWFECDDDIAWQLLGLQEAGFRHGRKGWYPDSDFSSDADWVYGVGASIRHLEELLNDDDGSVFELYSEAHSVGFRDYENELETENKHRNDE